MVSNASRKNQRVQKNDFVNIRVPTTCSILVCITLLCTSAYAAQCPGELQQVVGTIYCDNQFTLWVNGQQIATDPISFTPHQAVRVTFDWDGSSNLTYAIQCEDYASTSGFEYIESPRPQLGDGALIAEFDDGMSTVTSADWKVLTATFGPTDESYAAGCSGKNLDRCEVEKREIPNDWMSPTFDANNWVNATTYTAAQAGWGRRPTWSAGKGCCTLTSPNDRSTLGCDSSVAKNQCLVPQTEFSNTDATFIWAADLERDNRVLFRYTATCE